MNTDKTWDAAIVAFILWFYVADIRSCITHSVYIIQKVRTYAKMSETYVEDRTFVIVTSKRTEPSLSLTSRNQDITTVIEMINLLNRQSGNIFPLGI